MARKRCAAWIWRAASLLAVAAMAGALALACGQPDGGAGPGAAGGQGATPTASGGAASPSPDARIEHPTGPGEAVIRIEQVGGLVPTEARATRVPLFTLSGDGCAVVDGPQVAIYPPPALPNLLETCLTEAGVQEILHAAWDAGLLARSAEYRASNVADAPTTVFTVNAAGRRTVVRAEALGLDVAADPAASEEERQARAKLATFQAKVLDLRAWLPAGTIRAEEHPYAVERLQLVVQPVDPASDATPVEGTAPQERAWPLPAPLGGFGQPFPIAQGARCGVVEGEALAPVLAELRPANRLTRWTSGGATYAVLARPLLPGETACAADGA